MEEHKNTHKAHDNNVLEDQRSAWVSHSSQRRSLHRNYRPTFLQLMHSKKYEPLLYVPTRDGHYHGMLWTGNRLTGMKNVKTRSVALR